MYYIYNINIIINTLGMLIKNNFIKNYIKGFKGFLKFIQIFLYTQNIQKCMNILNGINMNSACLIDPI